MRLATIAASILVGGIVSSAVAGNVRTATGEVTLESVTNHVEPILSASGKLPGRDVRSFRVSSDGTHLTLTATMTEPAAGTWADDVVRMFVDTDDDAATGAAATFTDVSGFELQVDLNLCVKYDNGAVACAGEGGKKAAAHFATAVVKRTASGEEVRDVWDLPEAPVESVVVEAKVPYADLGVESGQTVRIYARESNGPMDASSYFPQVRLTVR